MSAVYLGYERVLPDELQAFRSDLPVLARFDGVVFLDPEDGLDPVFLALVARRELPETQLVLPLVARDRNRTALLGAARTAEAIGATAVLLLSGRLDPASPARSVYELDPLQMLSFVRSGGVPLDAWVSSRCATAAEKARVRSLGEAGASRCLVPWSAEEPSAACEALHAVFSVPESDWAAGRLPHRRDDCVLHVVPGRASAAAAARGG